MQRNAICCLCAIATIVTGLAHAQAPVRAAFMYCSWPNGQAAFKNEFDEAFKSLGWQVTKFENKQAQELSDRLGDFDIVVGGGVSNLDNPQDFTPFAAQWQAFLNRGGVVIATDASYAGISAQWIGGLDPALKTMPSTCSAYTKGGEAIAVKFVSGDPLLAVPYHLESDLAAKTNWCHLEQFGEGWTKAVTCFDDKPLLVYRPYGKGLVIVTNYFAFAGSTTAGAHLLANAWWLAQFQQHGLKLTAATLPTQFHLGDNQLSLTVANPGAEAAPLALRLEAKSGAAAAVAADCTKIVPTGEEAVIPLAFKLPVRGTYECTVTLTRNGETLLQMRPTMVVPQLLAARLNKRHAFVNHPELTVPLALSPELQGRLATLRVEMQPVGAMSGKLVTATLRELAETKTVPLGSLVPGAYDLVATLYDGDKKLADARLPFVLHPRPRVYFNDKNVCFVDNKPFFPLGMYHVAWSATKAQMLQCVEDLAAMGFNTVHTSCTNLDAYQEVLDRAQALGLHVIPEGIGAGSPAMLRFKNHPAILAWNSGDEPDGSGTPPEAVGASIDAVRDTDFDHPLYTTLCVPSTLAKYAPVVDVFSSDPYPIAGGSQNAIQVAKQTAQARDLVHQQRPLWIVPQCFGYADGPWQIPTPAQERSMSYQALIEGANGLIWYVYDDVKFKLMGHPELVAMMKQLTTEIKALTPFLLDPAFAAQRFQAGPEGCVRASVIKDGNTLLIMAAHTNDKDLGPQELTVPGLPAGAKAEVMFENLPPGAGGELNSRNRTVETAGGKITDNFGPYAVHVYRVKL